MAKRSQSFALFLVLAASALGAGPREVKPGWNLFSKQQDVELGREAAAQVERQMPVVRDAQLQSYVEGIGRKLVSTGLADDYPYSFKVVNDKSINAFALPGGPTFVNTGLIAAADNEAQLAGVMAHEISHVALRHGTNQASKANLIQLPAMLAGAVVGNGSMLGQLAQLGIGLGANSVLLKYSRNAESDADILGSRMMAKAGYNPIEMARFFEKLEAQGGSSGPQFLSSHPNPGNRMHAIQEEIQYMPRANYTTGNNGQLQNIKSRLGACRQRRRDKRNREPLRPVILALRAECASIVATLSVSITPRIGKHSGTIRAQWSRSLREVGWSSSRAATSESRTVLWSASRIRTAAAGI